MDKYYKYFLTHFQKYSETLFPILKENFKKNGNKFKFKYAYIPRYNFLINNISCLPIITNFDRQFYFSIDPNKIKKIKLIEDDKVTEFWTIDSAFTKYYLLNYVSKRICIKKDNSYLSIDFEKEENFKCDTFFILPKELYDFEKITNSFLTLDYTLLSEEFNFLKEINNYNPKHDDFFEVKTFDRMKTFFYNEKTGITNILIKNVYLFYGMKNRIFYFNCNYFYRNMNKRRKYLLFFLNSLFEKNEAEESKEFITKIFYDLNPCGSNFESIFEYIINYFTNTNERNITIIFDDIYSLQLYNLMKNLERKNNLAINEKVTLIKYIQLNKDTVQILKDVIDNDELNRVSMIGKNYNKNLNNDFKIAEGLTDDNKNFLRYYKKNINDKLRKLLYDYSFDKYIDLIKLYYYLYTDKIEKKIMSENSFIDTIKDFLEFLYIQLSDDLIEIKFRNKIIEYYFNIYYIHYSNLYFNENSKYFLNNILEAENGYNFERQIIFSLIIGKMSKEYEKIYVNRIYCLEKIVKINFENYVLFYQKIPNAPLYDFAILIKDNTGKIILKTYQVFINKTMEEIKKLLVFKIFFDLNYFIQIICRVFNIKINEFTFGLITSYKKVSKNPIFENISKFCSENKYELLLFDIEKNNFYTCNNYEPNNFKILDSFQKLDTQGFKIMKIFKDNFKISKKYYIEKIKPEKIISLINEKFFSLTNIDIKNKIELVGKFDCDISCLEQNDEIIYYYEINNNEKYIYYNGYELYNKNNKKKKVKSKKLDKKKVLAFYIKNSANLKEEYFLNCPKISFYEQEEDKEKDINYLISNEKDDTQNFFDEEESNSFETRQKEEEGSKTEIIEAKNINSPNIYTGSCEKSIDNSEDNKNDNDKIKRLNDEFTDSNNFGYKIIPIKKEEYENILNGNFEFLQNFHKNLRKKYMTDQTPKKIKLLGKKTKRSNI